MTRISSRIMRAFRRAVQLFALMMIYVSQMGPVHADSDTRGAKVYHRVRQGVVRVICGDRQGTAFTIQSPRAFITAAHVVDSGRKIMLQAFSGPAVQARVVRIDRRTDLAELQTDVALPVRPLERSHRQTDVASRVCLLGHPFPGYANNKGAPLLAFTWSCGRVVNRGQGYWVIDAAVNPGQSGAPLVDEDGRWLGVVVRRFVRGENLAQAIEPTAVDKLLNLQEIKGFSGKTSSYTRFLYLLEIGVEGRPEHSLHLGGGFRVWDSLEFGLRGWLTFPVSAGTADFPVSTRTDWGLGLDLSFRGLVGVGNKFIVLRPGVTIGGVYRSLTHKDLFVTPATDCPRGLENCSRARTRITDLETQVRALVRGWLGLDLGALELLVDFAYLPQERGFSGGGGLGLEF